MPGTTKQKSNKIPQKPKPVKKEQETEKEEEVREKPVHKRTSIPLSFYWFKDVAREFVSHKNFPDSLASTFAMASVAIAFPFYPLLLLIPLLIITFILARIHPLIGLMALLFITLPMFIYQAPLLAWLLTLFISAALMLGFRHYRTITILYALIMLPLSFLGFIVEIPAFILGILYVGLKRGAAITVMVLLIVPMLSGLTGIHNTAPIVYNLGGFRESVGSSTALSYLTPTKSITTMSNFGSSFSSAIGSFFSFSVGGLIVNMFSLAGSAIAYQIEVIAIQLVAWLVVLFTVSNYVVKSRSPYKGTEASIYEVIIAAVFVILAFVTPYHMNLWALSGFVVAPLMLFSLEFNDISVVKTLEVMKQDFFGKFSGMYEDLSLGTNETLEDVANYNETKKEIKQALLAPIEHREIVSAYHVRIPKGILLFGPPGTGKTLIMRAVSNELRARFLYVKTSSIISPYPGESAQMLSKIFETARKHRPAVLFFDEIDSIASKRDMQESENSRLILSTLLTEMDGFQKIEGVVIVGTTNVPHMLDPSMLRPGRFDKIIYMALPDREGRREIFKYYAKKYPMSPDLDLEKLANITNRYSGADIANACQEAAKKVAEVALEKAGILKVETEDIEDVVKSIKPSTSLSQIADYEKFKMDYERRVNPEEIREGKEIITVDDVVGLEDAKKAMRESIEIPLMHPNLIEKYDIKNISGILLFGPPGTGKTMLMKAVANSVGEFRMITVSGSDITRQGIDRAVEMMKEIFDRAKENAPSIIFIDEIDSIVPDREHASEFGVQLTGEFLRELDDVKDSGVIVIGATNRPDSLDAALIRPGRLDKLIFTPPPSKEERSKLFENNLKKAPLSENIDFVKLGEMTQGYTGADITNICRQAKMEALESSVSETGENVVTEEILEKLVKSTRPSAPSIVIGRYLTFLTTHGKR